MPEGPGPYTVTVGNRARRFIRRHQDLQAQWLNQIIIELANQPRAGSRINHLKGEYNCSYRWRSGTYRILYDVYDDYTVDVYDADVRGDIY